MTEGSESNSQDGPSDCQDMKPHQKADSSELALVQQNVLMKSNEDTALLTTPIKGYDFNRGINYGELLKSYATTGFQASILAQAIKQINKMLEERSKPLPTDVDQELPNGRKKHGCTIFLGYTSNLVSSGIRDILRFIVEHDLVDAVVTTAGGIEEDLIKVLEPSFLGSFAMDGKYLREKALNRAGNILIPNKNYCKFEEWVNPIFDKCLEEQEAGFSWTPSKLIKRLGTEIGKLENGTESILYWAARHNIPVFCPALTDGSLGDMLYIHSVSRSPGLNVDIVEDVRALNTIAVRSHKTGSLILGGGVVKHHINNANLMRNGSDYTVYVNTGQEFDGSDSGARPDEAVSWGKIKASSEAVKVYAEATLVFPLIVAETFAKKVHGSE